MYPLYKMFGTTCIMKHLLLIYFHFLFELIFLSNTSAFLVFVTPEWKLYKACLPTSWKYSNETDSLQLESIYTLSELNCTYLYKILSL